ncbi:MAG: hypothetical protein E7252_08265 [Lachnospira sp.]|nr:hypothetical protein [Lachnospira sp.]
MKKYIKTIISIICIVVVLVCVAITIKKEMPEKEVVTTTDSNQATTAVNSEALPKVITDSNGITKALLDPNQICDNSKPIVINCYNDGKLSKSVELVVSDATISREFKNYDEVREERADYINWLKKFYDVEMLYADDNETFNDGIAFYVYITVTMTNLHTIPMSLHVNSISTSSVSFYDGNYEAIRCVGSEYGKKEYMEYSLLNDPTYSRHLSGIEPFVNGNDSYYYKTGESQTAEVIFRVADEYIKNDNLYLACPFGTNFKIAGADINQKYIKVNITNRGDYFE